MTKFVIAQQTARIVGMGKTEAYDGPWFVSFEGEGAPFVNWLAYGDTIEDAVEAAKAKLGRDLDHCAQLAMGVEFE